MKVLIVHNNYLERGGEDEVVRSEIEMLENFGNKVIFYERSNKEIEQFNFFRKLHFFIRDIIWSDETYREVKRLIREEKPDIAHIHNIFIVISPAIYYTLSQKNIPIVQTLHNYRFICPNGLFYRHNTICEECKTNNFTPSIIHRCWRNSFFLTLFLARMLRKHFKMGTLEEKIDTFIVLNEFSKKKFIERGFPEQKMFIKPNFVDIGNRSRVNKGSDYALFVGRLADYKGINTLISAYEKLPNYNLKIVGDGPLYKELSYKTRAMNNIELVGRLTHDRTIDYIRNSSFVIFPSECYESMPRVIIESFACGVPVIASNIGSVREFVQDKVTGLLFEYKNSDDLSSKVKYLPKNKRLINEMGENARKVYEKRYTSVTNYAMLMDIYNKTIEHYKTKEL